MNAASRRRATTTPARTNHRIGDCPDPPAGVEVEEFAAAVAVAR
jgi:hypothetical protein